MEKSALRRDPLSEPSHQAFDHGANLPSVSAQIGNLYSPQIVAYRPPSGLPKPPLEKEDLRQQERRSLNSVAGTELPLSRQDILLLIANTSEQDLAQVVGRLATSLADQPNCEAIESDTAQAARPAQSARILSARQQFGFTGQDFAQRRYKNGKLKLPKLPPGLRWPRKKFSKERKRTGITIEQFLRNEWLPLIEAGYGELRWLRAVDITAAHGIEDFERVDRKTGERTRLPVELHFLTEREVTNRRLVAAITDGGWIKSDPRLAYTIARRVHRGELSLP